MTDRDEIEREAEARKMLAGEPKKDRIAELFANQGLHANARFIASIDPRACDYLQEAPVLALAFGVKHNTRADRLYVASRIGGPISRGEKLKTVMNAAGMAYPLRKISAKALFPSARDEVRALSNVDPSTLPQIIPAKSGAQRHWLQCLSAYRTRMRIRNHHKPTDFRWLALQVSRSAPDRIEVESFADFVASNSGVTVEGWQWNRAMNEVRLWHDRLNSERGLSGLGALVRPETVIDFSAWPDHCEVDGYEIFKLTTPSMLMEEGRLMRHCVASYIPLVFDGKTSIFSIRKSMKRVATMQITGKRVVQLCGFANRHPSYAIKRLAQDFARREHLPADLEGDK